MGESVQWLSGGSLAWSWWKLILVGMATTYAAIVAVTIYLHRCETHRALTLRPVVAHCLRFWLWLTTGMVTREWVAVHRCHHAHCETARGPHSPSQAGINEVLWRGGASRGNWPVTGDAMSCRIVQKRSSFALATVPPGWS